MYGDFNKIKLLHNIFIKNSAKINGGVISLTSSLEIFLYNSIFDSNWASHDGGAINILGY